MRKDVNTEMLNIIRTYDRQILLMEQSIAGLSERLEKESSARAELEKKLASVITKANKTETRSLLLEKRLEEQPAVTAEEISYSDEQQKRALAEYMQEAPEVIERVFRTDRRDSGRRGFAI